MAVLARVSYGMTMVQALARMAQSTGDADVAALASAMRIQQRFGGSMGAVLDLIAEHAQGRALMQQELRSELAGTRMATVVVACAMPAIFAFMFATNPAFSLFYRENRWGGPCLRALRSWRWRVLRRAVGSQGSRIRRGLRRVGGDTCEV